MASTPIVPAGVRESMFSNIYIIVVAIVILIVLINTHILVLAGLSGHFTTLEGHFPLLTSHPLK